MFGTYLRRELANRRRQTIIIAIGMSLAIALVILVNAAAAGVRSAQGTALQNVYGVGTDITVTKPATGPPRTAVARTSGSVPDPAAPRAGRNR